MHTLCPQLDQLSNLVKLQHLEASSNDISSLQPLSVLTCLTTLSIEHNHVSSLSPLVHLTELLELYAADNAVSDVRVRMQQSMSRMHKDLSITYTVQKER
jgi:Leucine-rich repeat (LRR) protein